MPHPKNKEDKNINPNISRQASHRHPKHTTSHSPAHQRGINSPPPTRMRAQVPPNTKSTQTTEPTLTIEGKNQKEEEYDPKAWEKEISNGVSWGEKMKRQKYSTKE